jgi:hypothetical protein
MDTSDKGERKATRQCWDCLKRRLVCDHTLPHCKKCQKAGRECSGYDEQKPLQWIETGKVTSRRRKKDSPPKLYTFPSREKEQASGEPASLCSDPHETPGSQTLQVSEAVSSDVTLPSFEEHFTAWRSYVDFQLAYTCFAAENEAQWNHLAEDGIEKMLRELAFKQVKSAQDVEKIFQIGGKAKIEEVVSKQQHDEAGKMLRSEREPLKRLERLLWGMRVMDLPSYDLSNETSEVVQAVHYCKRHVSCCATSALQLTNENRQPAYTSRCC